MSTPKVFDESVNDLFRITFKIDNAEFEENGRDETIANVLERVAEQIRRGVSGGIVRDVNGNRIGDYGVKLADGHTMP
jgi:hypothetical protein